MDMGQILFLDIETVSQYKKYSELSETAKYYWGRKANTWLRAELKDNEDEIATLYEDKAAIFAEFGKIICISVGFITRNPHTQVDSFRVKSFYGEDEKYIIEQFFQLVDKYFGNPSKHKMCGHNIREFDIPYICRRAIIHGMTLPNMLQIAGKKPWEVKQLIDTLEDWKFGDVKNFTSLALLAHILDIPTPKDDIDGSMVGKVYWNDQDLERIKVYCQKDVVTVAHVYHRMQMLPFNAKDDVIIVA